MAPPPRRYVFFLLCMLGAAFFGASMDAFLRRNQLLVISSVVSTAATPGVVVVVAEDEVLGSSSSREGAPRTISVASDAKSDNPTSTESSLGASVANTMKNTINSGERELQAGNQDHPLCHANPYERSLLPGHSFELAEQKAQDYLGRIKETKEKVFKESHFKYGHDKFNGFEEMAQCNYTCTGGKCGKDSSKYVCGVDTLQPGCIIYSIGGNNKWEFEEHMYRLTPCEIHTFDCTGSIERFTPPPDKLDRLHFHHICLNSEEVPEPETKRRKSGKFSINGAMMPLDKIQQKFNHTRLDLLKMDIEGFECPIFDSWPELSDKEASQNVALPMQVLAEVHYVTQMKALQKTKARQEQFKTELDIVDLQAHLLRMGYIIANRDDNRRCQHCSELTLLRHKCL